MEELEVADDVVVVTGPAGGGTEVEVVMLVEVVNVVEVVEVVSGESVGVGALSETVGGVGASVTRLLVVLAVELVVKSVVVLLVLVVELVELVEDVEVEAGSERGGRRRRYAPDRCARQSGFHRSHAPRGIP